MSVLLSFLLGEPVAAYVRNQVVGPDNNIWRADIGPAQAVQVMQNDRLAPIQPGGIALSEPALGRLGEEIYLIRRGEDNKIYCNRGTGLSWTGWVELGGTTLDAPALASNGSTIYVVVRGIDFGVYYREVTNCGGAWVWTGQPMSASAPQVVADHSGFYIYIAAPDGEYRRHKIGTSGWPKVRRFASDAGMHGTKADFHDAASDECTQGYGAHVHRVHRYGPLPSLCRPAPSEACDVIPIIGLAFGSGTDNALCYGVEPSTGGLQINLRVAATDPGVEYLWRSCAFGFWNAGFEDDGCDFAVPSSFFPRMDAVTSVNLRGKVTVHSASHNGVGSNQLEFILWLYNPSANDVVEFVILPYYQNVVGCIESSGWKEHDSQGNVIAHGFSATIACVGLPNVPAGGTLIYDENIKDYINAKIADRLAGGYPDLSSHNPADWIIANGPWVGNEQSGGNFLNATVGDVVIDVLF